MEIHALAMQLTEAVSALVGRVRELYYAVILLGHACPACDGPLVMIAESRCRCEACGLSFDPTVAYQRCSDCAGPVRLRIRRYQCRRCGADVRSRFVFDGHVFDAAYFRDRMAESRERKRKAQELYRARAIADRSAALEPPPLDLDSVPGLLKALNQLTSLPDLVEQFREKKGFDLDRYQRHIEAHIGPIEVCFEDLPPLSESPRLDRICRFVAIIFMEHAGVIVLEQEGHTIWLRRTR
jgi:hypothetical protein